MVVAGGKGCDLIHTRCKKQRKKTIALCKKTNTQPLRHPNTENSMTVRKKTLTEKKIVYC